MTTRIKLRRDTAANWTANNPILAAGEPGLETDTGKTKYGDGTTAWTGLGYATGGITPREQIGYFNFHGTVPSEGPVDLWFEGVETDPAGNAYYVGGQYEWYDGDIQWPHVVKVNSLGELQWQKELKWADGYEGNAVSAVYNTATDQLVVVAEMWKMDNPEKGASVVVMNAETGVMVGDPTMIRDEVTSDGSSIGNIQPSDIILDSNGDPIVVGHKNGNATTYALTTTSVGATDVIFVDAAIFTDKTPKAYSDWYITGTNIGSEVSITAINEYTNQQPTAVPHTGTGATFTIDDIGDGTYGNTVVTGGGSGYVVGNKILVLGTDLGGATPANDGTITVTGIDAGAITGISISGTAAGTTSTSYSSITGTNIVSGSNAIVSVVWKIDKNGQAYFPDNASRFGSYVSQYGSGYVLGDTLYLNPNQYGGSTSATITVTEVGGSGELYNFAFTGTFNTSTVKLMTNNSVDFSTTGSWTAVNYSSEAFVWTPTWSKTFGDNGFDKVNAVAQDSTGNIYLACQTFDDTIIDCYNNYGNNLPMLVKVTSTGTQVWSKKFTPANYDSDNDGYSGVAVDSNDDVIVAEDSVVTKISSTGTVYWQKRIIPDGFPAMMWNTCVDIDSDDNVYVAGEISSMFSASNDDLLVVKFDTDGNVLWQRELGTSDGESTSWDNGYQILSVDNGRVHLAGSTYNNDNNDVAIAMSFPTDGSGADTKHKGKFFIHTGTWEISTSTATVYNYTMVMNASQVTLTTETNFTCVTTSTDNSNLGLRTGSVDGRIEDLYSISFEDGSVQTTAYTGALIREENRVYNTNDFYPNITHANKLMRWDAENWNSTQHIYIPHNDDVPFPIGTQLHFVKERGINSFMFWTWANLGNSNDMRIIPSSPADGMENQVYNTSEGWSVRTPNYDDVPARATITKTDTNTWLLECSSTVHIMDWNW